MTAEEERSACRVTVRGVVQGVGFRFYCVQEAERLGVDGWVRNDPDGTVAGHFEGPTDAVDALVDWCREGPSYARVADVDVQPVAVTGAHSFSVL